MVLPLLLQVALEGRAERAIIVHACDTSIDLEGLDEKEFTLKQVFYFFAHVLFGKIEGFFLFRLWSLQIDKEKSGILTAGFGWFSICF